MSVCLVQKRLLQHSDTDNNSSNFFFILVIRLKLNFSQNCPPAKALVSHTTHCIYAIFFVCYTIRYLPISLAIPHSLGPLIAIFSEGILPIPPTENGSFFLKLQSLIVFHSTKVVQGYLKVGANRITLHTLREALLGKLPEKCEFYPINRSKIYLLFFETRPTFLKK